jgi:SAM-dependent methyltransferase
MVQTRPSGERDVKSIEGVASGDVASLYEGTQGDLFRLLMGQQLHVGGMNATLDLAERARIEAGSSGIDLCCGNGAGMRVLVRSREVGDMVGVDITARNIKEGRARVHLEGFEPRIRFLLADATASGLPSTSADFVWGEDAWCYVADKGALIAEAARLVRPAGTIAFSDWVEGRVGLSGGEADRFLRLMRFANILDSDGYVRLLQQSGCDVLIAEETGRLAAYFDLFVDLIEMQLTYDALATVGYRIEVFETMISNLRFIRDLAHAGKIVQARFIAKRAPAA